jgi:hypothetical protein
VYLFPTALIVVVKVQHEHRFTLFLKTIRFKNFTSEHLVPYVQLRQIYPRLQNTEIYKTKHQAHTHVTQQHCRPRVTVRQSTATYCIMLLTASRTSFIHFIPKLVYRGGHGFRYGLYNVYQKLRRGIRTCYRPTRDEGLMGYKGSSFRKTKGP